MSHELKHGDLVRVRVSDTETAIAEFNRYDEDDEFFAFFGTDWTANPDEVEVVEKLAVVPSE